MNKEHHRRLLEQAGSATMERIRRDGEKAPSKIKALFPYLEEHLFNRNIDVNRLRRDCGIRDNSLSMFFVEVTGRTPHAYIIERRLETAAALIRDTDLRVWIIAKLTGFSQHCVFGRNFKKLYGMSPRAFRSGVRKIIAKAGGRPTAHRPSVDELRKALAHGMESRESLELTMHMTYHNAREGTLPPPPLNREPETELIFERLAFRKEELDAMKVEVVWESLKEQPWANQKAMIRNLTFATPVFFHFLRQKSIPEGRDNRQLGVHLAELALQSLRVTELVIEKDLLDLRAQGWTWVGNARRLAYDFIGADEAFSNAAIYLKKERNKSLVHAEYYGMKSALRRYQRRYDEASVLHAHALPIFRKTGLRKDIAASLIDGACTHELAGRIEEAISCLTEALKLLKSQTDHYLELTGLLNLTSLSVRVRDFQLVRDSLPRIRELIDKAGRSNIFLYHIQWIEGWLYEDIGKLSNAEDRYQSTREGFLKQDQGIHAAIVTLDLALLWLKQGRNDEVRRLITEVIPVLECIDYYQEAVAAIKLLRCATQEENLLRILEGAKKSLRTIQLEQW